jgi:hypothetical protein
MADTVKVVFAVYGALTDGWYDEGEQSVRRMTAMAGDVASTLQTLLNNTPNKVVTINNANMSPGGGCGRWRSGGWVCQAFRCDRGIQRGAASLRLSRG